MKLSNFIIFTLIFISVLNAGIFQVHFKTSSKNKFEASLADIFSDGVFLCSPQNEKKFQILSISDFTKKLLEQNEDNLNYLKDIKISQDFSDFFFDNISNNFKSQNLKITGLSFNSSNKVFSAKALAKFSLSQAPPFV